ncbi:MAG: amidohydrolase [Chloroflexi bacterium]|nr:amidohydrolase [Chloroflexota bacterium]
MLRPDLVLYQSNVITMDPQRPKGELVAVSGSKIVAVGNNSDMESLCTPSTEVIDLQGKTLIPGFNDAHMHFRAYAASLLSLDCSPTAVSSIADIKAALRQRVLITPPGRWIRGVGYNEFYLADKRHPTRWDLDEVSPHHPVRLNHRSGHACVLNSRALSLVGIGPETSEPPGGIIDRNWDSGELTGILYEMDEYLKDKVEPLTEEELAQGVKQANQQLLSFGITSFQDATVSNDLSQGLVFAKWKEKGQLVPRVWIMTGFESLPEIGEGRPPLGPGLSWGATKIIVDETTGDLHPSQEELNQQVLTVHQAGLQVAIHVIEEPAIEAAATALERALEQIPRKDHRHRLEHCSVCPPELLERLKGVGAVVVSQPPFLYYSGERYLAEVPNNDLRWLYRFRSFWEGGLRPAASSDCPVVPPNPLVGIYGAVTRRAETGKSVLPEERVSRYQALWMYTVAGAYTSFAETTQGSITPGKAADLVVLSDDPLTVPKEEIKNIKVEKTIIGGRIVGDAAE